MCIREPGRPAQRRGQTAAGLDRHLVHRRGSVRVGPAMGARMRAGGQVLDQRAPERHVEHLGAAADGEQRTPDATALRARSSSSASRSGSIPYTSGSATSSIAGRVDIATAQQDDARERRQQFVRGPRVRPDQYRRAYAGGASGLRCRRWEQPRRRRSIPSPARRR